MNNASKIQFQRFIIVISAMIVPGSGYVILGKPMRGFLIICWMFVFGYITFNLTTEQISLVGRFSGAFAVWILSILEIHRLVNKKIF